MSKEWNQSSLKRITHENWKRRNAVFGVKGSDEFKLVIEWMNGIHAKETRRKRTTGNLDE